MEEKKLTDEEIVKALEDCNREYTDMNRHSCDTCPYRDIEPCGKAQMTDCIDLIHRLQAKYRNLEINYNAVWEDFRKYEIENAEQKKELDRLKKFELHRIKEMKKQKDEIERLKEELDGTVSMNEMYIKEVKQNEELQKQVEAWKARAKELEQAWEISSSNEEKLQKQVDELTDELGKAYETERANIRAEIADAGTSCHWCERQTIKDTVKDILDKAIIIDKNTGNRGFICIEALTELCKSKGVEVE